MQSPAPRSFAQKAAPKSGHRKKRTAVVGAGTGTHSYNKSNGGTNQNYPVHNSAGNSVKTTLNPSLGGSNLKESPKKDQQNSLIT